VYAPPIAADYKNNDQRNDAKTRNNEQCRDQPSQVAPNASRFVESTTHARHQQYNEQGKNNDLRLNQTCSRITFCTSDGQGTCNVAMSSLSMRITTFANITHRAVIVRVYTGIQEWSYIAVDAQKCVCGTIEFVFDATGHRNHLDNVCRGVPSTTFFQHMRPQPLSPPYNALSCTRLLYACSTSSRNSSTNVYRFGKTTRKKKKNCPRASF
jgi:hypothetical protein